VPKCVGLRASRGGKCARWRAFCRRESEVALNLKGNHLSLWAAKSDSLEKHQKGLFSPLLLNDGSCICTWPDRRCFRFLHFGIMSEAFFGGGLGCSVLSLILVFGLPAYLQTDHWRMYVCVFVPVV
jgi:hypothetical protein